MNENAKTMVFIGAAAVVALVVWVTQPASPVSDPNDLRGQALFPEFDDPLAATSMEIVEFDEDRSEVRPFQVAQAETKDGKRRWSIPSHDNYPADAEDQLADAAAGMMGLEILNVASDSPGEHEEYGVVDPDPKTVKVGATGVGTRVTMKDSTGKELLSLIIGNEVEGRDGLRYVRLPGKDQVFTTAVKTDKLATEFEEWIEKDLLKLSTWDIRRLWLRNHAVDELQGALIQRGEITLDYDDTGDPKWKLLKDEEFKEGEWVAVPTPDDEELNTEKLDDLKSALDDLKIVDVRRKPAGLSANLKAADDFTNNRDAVESLAGRGFYVAKLGDRVELFSNEGEVRCLMKSGVEYVLRFGEIATGSATSSSEEDGDDSTSSGMNRYLFVACEFNPDIIPKPEFEELPPEEEEPAEEAKPAEEEKAEGEETAEPADADAETADDASEEKSQADAERERIEKDNQRKQDEYDEKVKEGQDKVKELNARFSDWYYVISDEVFQKIHLDREDVFKKKEKEEEEEEKEGEDAAAGSNEEPAESDNPIDSFDALKESGPGE